MRFSKTSDYALRVMIALANAGEVKLSLQTISKQERVPRKFLEHVVRSLRNAKLIQSAPGPKGGYTLKRPAASISLAEIIDAAQGPLLSMERDDPAKVPEHLRDTVEKVHTVIADIRVFARQRLESITLTEMAEVREADLRPEEIMYYI